MIRVLNKHKTKKKKEEMRDKLFEVEVDRNLEEIYPDYLKQLNHIVIKVQTGLLEENAGHAKNYGHQLAGNAASYGLEELGLIGEKLEKLSSLKRPNFKALIKVGNELDNYVTYLKVKFK